MSAVPLTQAVTSGDPGAVSTVLANGADVNERTGGGQTPLILATIFGHAHLIPLLLDAGADPQLRDNLGLNAIDWAQRRGASEVIDLLNGKSATSRTRFETIAPAPPSQPVPPSRAARSLNPKSENTKSVSEEERGRRWIEGLKQRIAEQSQTEILEGPNIFRPQQEAPTRFEAPPPPLEAPASRLEPMSPLERRLRARLESPPQPEIPSEPKPQPEIPAQPEPQPEIPARPPDPQPEIPAYPAEPEIPTPPAREIPAQPPSEVPTPPAREIPGEPLRSQVKTSVAKSNGEISLAKAEEESPRSSSNRKRCPECNAVYNSELVSYCSYHAVPLVDVDVPIISEPPKPSPVMFWMIIGLTLIASIVLGSMATKYLYNSTTPQEAAAPPPAPVTVQKGIPALDEQLTGKAIALPIAESPLNGQEAIPGTVVVRVVIDGKGQVTEAHASGGDWLLRRAASEAALKSTFVPEKLRSRETEGTITYTFEP